MIDHLTGRDTDRENEVAVWARSGAMALTGRAEGAPLVGPAIVASAMAAAAEDLRVDSGRWGRAVHVDGPALLGERAALAGLTRRGDVSVGGAARFVRTLDGWVVLNLPRPEDVAALPALVGAAVDPDDWPSIAARLAARPSVVVIETAVLLGLAVGAPGSTERPAHPAGETHRGGARAVVARPLVVDLTALWAGPLLTSLLAEAGARVVKVEGRERPDGGRQGTPAFFDLLNHDKECVTVDFDDPSDVSLLRRLIAVADLVVEGSRPRVMDRLGIAPEAVADTGTSWLSITAHGRSGFAGLRVGFGDDTAVAGGLYVAGDPPMFVGDAIADPIAGLAGAAVAADLLGSSRAAVIELPLARTAAWVTGKPAEALVVQQGDEWVVDGPEGAVVVEAPRSRSIPIAAPAAGAHDAAIRAELADGATVADR